MIKPALLLNKSYNDNPNKSLVDALNVELDYNFQYLVNESGNVLKHSFTGFICGVIPTPNVDIVFTVDEYDMCEIFKINDESKELILKGNFGFNVNNSITGVYTYNSHGELIIAFTDNINLRMLNVDNNHIPNSNKLVLQNHIDMLNINPNYKQPIYNSVKVTSGGSVKKGMYYLSLSYYIGEHDLLNYTLPSNPVPIFMSGQMDYLYSASYYNKKEDVRTSRVFKAIDVLQKRTNTENTNKKIIFTISNLDTRYSKLKAVVVRKTDTISEVYDIGDFFIKGDTMSINFDGGFIIKMDINEITIPSINIKKSKYLASQNNSLIFANIETEDIEDYQKYANNIKVSYTLEEPFYDKELTDKVKDYSSYENQNINNPPFAEKRFYYNEATNCFNFKGAMPDDVMALYIGLVLKNGNLHRWYHIPGRAPIKINKIRGVVVTDTVYDTDKISAIEKYIHSSYGVFKDEKIYKFLDTSSLGNPQLLANAELEIDADSIDLTSISNTRASFTIKIDEILDEANEQNTNLLESSLSIAINRVNVKEDIYKELNPHRNDFKDIINVNLGDISGRTKEDIMIELANNIQTAFDINSLDYQYPLERFQYTSVYDEVNKRIIITTNIQGSIGNDLTNELTIFSQKDKVIKYTYTSFDGGEPSQGIHTGTDIKVEMGNDEIALYTIQPDDTLHRIYKNIASQIRDKELGFEVDDTNRWRLTIYANPTLGSLIVDNEDYIIRATSATGISYFQNNSLFKGGNYDEEYGRLAYWENENEEYPDTPDFDIWKVNISGIGEPDLSGEVSIRGKKVRHHKMPSLRKISRQYSAYNKIISLNINNINIPNSILNNIQGVTIGYASRSSNNITTLGMAPITKNNLYEEIRWGKNPMPDKDIRFMDYNLVNNKVGVSNAFLRKEYGCDLTYINPSSTTTGIRIGDVCDASFIFEYDDEVYKVDNAEYVPRNNSAAIVNNEGREDALILRLNRDYDDTNTHYLYGSTGTTLGKLSFGSLNAIADNLYYPYYSQKIVIAGNIKPIYNSVNKYSISKLKGFDTHLNCNLEFQFRGNQRMGIGLTEDSEEILERLNSDKDEDPTSVVTFYNYKSYSIINHCAREVNLDAPIIDRNVQKNWLNKSKYFLIYASNFNHNPELPHNIEYNIMYSFVNNLKVYYGHNNLSIFTNKFPNRLYRSNVQSKEALSIGWRKVEPFSYYEVGKEKGSICNIAGSDIMLVIHCNYSLFIAKLKDRISYENEDIYLGQADIFDRPPQEVRPSNTGNLAIQSHLNAVINDLGYCFYNPYLKTIVIYSNENILELNMLGINEVIQSKFTSKSNINSIYDDLVLISNNANKYKLIISNKEIGKEISLSYCYYPQIKSIVSKHINIPIYTFESVRGLYSIANTGKSIYKESIGAKGLYFGTQYESYIDVLINEPVGALKQLTELGFSSSDDKSQRINKIIVYTENQVSKEYILFEFDNILDWDKVRYSNGLWWYNNIRDYSSDDIVQNIIQNNELNTSTINEEKQWFELSMFEDYYFIVRLIVDNTQDVVFKDLAYNFNNIQK